VGVRRNLCLARSNLERQRFFNSQFDSFAAVEDASKVRRAQRSRPPIYRPSGVETSVPGGGVNSKVDGGISARDWFE
jgi:hypothetical protein